MIVAAAYEQSSLVQSNTYIPAQSGLEVSNHESMTGLQSTSYLIDSLSGHEKTNSFHGSTQMPNLHHLNADMQAPYRCVETGFSGFPLPATMPSGGQVTPNYQRLTGNTSTMDTDLYDKLDWIGDQSTGWANPPERGGAGEPGQMSWLNLNSL